MTSSPLLAALDIRPSDKVISVKERTHADANFVIAHLIKHCLLEGHHVCLVILHNTIGHYHNVGKRLGFDLVKKVAEGAVETIEPFKDIVEDIGGSDATYLVEDKERVIRELFRKIQDSVQRLRPTEGKTYLMIDDVSHLLDLGIELRFVINFVNCCLGLVGDQVVVVINTHVCGSHLKDLILANNLDYVADVAIEVAPLKTGFSQEVTGVISIDRNETRQSTQFHYKAFDRGIKTFHLGESVYNLYK